MTAASMMLKRSPLILIVSATLALLAACEFSLAQDVTPPPGYQAPAFEQGAVETPAPAYPAVLPNVGNGEVIYADKCAPCHGDAGLGDGPDAKELQFPVAAIGSLEVARQAAPAAWFRMVSEGNIERFMPPFQSLSEAERWDVVAYAFSLSTSKEELEAGEAVYAANCAACHGENGEGDGPEASNLAVKPADFSDQAKMAGLSAVDLFTAIRGGVGEEMPAFSGLVEEDVWAVSAYLRSLTLGSMTEGDALEAGLVPEETPVETGGPQRPEVTAEAEEAEAGSEDEQAPTEGEVNTAEEGEATVEQAAEQSVLVEGTVENGSGGELPEGLTVTLYGYDQLDEVLRSDTTVDGEGDFRFDEVELVEGRVLFTTVEYGGVTYGSEFVIVEGDKTTFDLPVTIYESTTDSSVLRVERLHIFFEFPAPEVMTVVQLFVITNQSNQAVVPSAEGAPSIIFDLPAQATNLVFQESELGDRFVLLPEGFGDLRTVLPGTSDYQLLFAYDLPYERALEFSLPISFDVGALIAFLPEGNVKLTSDLLEESGFQDLQGKSYQMYATGGLPAASEVGIKLSGRNPAGGAATIFNLEVGNSLFIGLGALVVALVAVGWYMRNRGTSWIEEGEGLADVGDLEAEGSAEALMDAIILLDELYEAGEVEEAAYEARRAALKARLAETLD